MGVIYERRVLDLEQKVKDLTECCHKMLDKILALELAALPKNDVLVKLRQVAV